MPSSSSVPAFTSTCLNCGAALAGAFCSGCGQEHRHERLRVGDWLHDVLDATSSLDSRIWRTIAALTVRPGHMAREYVEGHRAPFVSPLRYALATCALWWFGVALVNDETASRTGAWWIEYGQLVNLASVPFIALAMQWPFRASRYNYAETLSFALYTTGHVFLWRAGLALIGFIGDPGNALDYADSVLYFVPLGRCGSSMRAASAGGPCACLERCSVFWCSPPRSHWHWPCSRPRRRQGNPRSVRQPMRNQPSVVARVALALACAAGYSAGAAAHHSTAEYDSGAVVEARGEVVKVLWANPHVRLEISTERFDGVAQPWLLEGQSPGDLDRAQIPRDLVTVGQTVTFAGNPSTRRERRMYVTNVLLPDGTELALRTTAQPRWAPDRYLSYRRATVDPDRAAADSGEGLFRIWVPTESKTPDWAADPPLTAAARAAWRRFDALRDDPIVDCTPPGMPQIVTRSGRYAIRFVRSGADIVIENEYRDLKRLVRMNADRGGAPPAPTPLGYSTGRFDGATLVVTTTAIDWPLFQLYGLEGVPQSRDMTIVERFTPSADGTELTYDISATDPKTFTRTVTAEGYRTFRWQPGFQFLPPDCVLDDGSR